jgi:hypothetical protein
MELEAGRNYRRFTFLVRRISCNNVQDSQTVLTAHATIWSFFHYFPAVFCHYANTFFHSSPDKPSPIAETSRIKGITGKISYMELVSVIGCARTLKQV